jgi:hypothetical protein
MQKSCEFDLIEIKLFCWLDQTKILVTYTFGYWSEVLLFPACPTCGSRMLLVLHSADLCGSAFV